MNSPTGARREWTLIAVAALAGAVLRFWNLPRLGIDHFDEGIYALAGSWITHPKGLAAYDPGTIAYAPPGYPILVGVSYLVFGVRDTAAIVVSILAGIATIPVVGWLGRRAFGAGAGAAAAWLCALSGPHVAFSRTALTDALALLTFLVALGLGMRFLERPGFVRAAAFGLAVGVAQNVKYSGFLSGAIVALAWFVGLFHVKLRGQGALLRTVTFGVVAAVVAALCYVPWYVFVQGHGGYARLLEHQRGYTSGIAAWPAHWYQQMAQLIALSGLVLGRIAWAGPAALLAVIGAAVVGLRGSWMRVAVVALIAVALLGWVPALGWWGSLGAVLVVAGRRAIRPLNRPLGPASPARGEAKKNRPMRSEDLTGMGTAAGVVCMAWLAMSALTPFYHPYARLWLPVEAMGWVIVAGLIADVVRARVARRASSKGVAGVETAVAFEAVSPPYRAQGGSPGRVLKGACALVALAGAAWTTFGSSPRPVAWPWLLAPTDGLRRTSDAIAAALRTDAGAAPIVGAQPPLVFYLTTAGVRCRRVARLDGLAASNDWLIVDELQVRIGGRGDASELAAFQGARPFPYWLSAPTLRFTWNEGRHPFCSAGACSRFRSRGAPHLSQS